MVVHYSRRRSFHTSSLVVLLLVLGFAFATDQNTIMLDNATTTTDTTQGLLDGNVTRARVLRGATTSTADRNLQASCGNGNRGNGVCDNGQCCSQYGWCGTSAAHCSSQTTSGSTSGSTTGTCGNGNRGNGKCANGQCCSQYGWCGTSAAHCSSQTTSGNTSGSTAGTCGNGNRGNGKCANGQCCSQYGWCGTSSAHCSGSTSTTTTTTTSSSGNVLYSGSGSGTFYYDVAGKSCYGQSYAENNGYPSCTSYNPAFYKTLKQYGTNKIVAIDNNILAANRAGLCGKQIQVYKNGVEVSGGPYFVWDGCAACIGGGRIDFSLSVLDDIDNGNACRDGVVPGISWRVTDRQIQNFVP